MDTFQAELIKILSKILVEIYQEKKNFVVTGTVVQNPFIKKQMIVIHGRVTFSKQIKIGTLKGLTGLPINFNPDYYRSQFLESSGNDHFLTKMSAIGDQNRTFRSNFEVFSLSSVA